MTRSLWSDSGTPHRSGIARVRTAFSRTGSLAHLRTLIADGAWVTLLAGVTIAPILAGAELPRNALWAVVRACVAAHDSLRTPFPCLAVRLGPPSVAILRAPGRRTHLIVVPTVRLSGLESTALRTPPVFYWRAALDARSFVVSGAGGRLPLGDVALAINSRRSRSQDQFHIHAACASPDALRQVRERAAQIGSNWVRLPEPIEDSTYWARRVSHAAAVGKDDLASLRMLPRPIDLSQVTVGAINLAEDGTGDWAYLLSDSGTSAAEDIFDLSCAIAATK